MPRLIWHEDEPLGHLASVPLYFVSELARATSRSFAGEGSDELMAGINRHWKTVYNLSLGARYYGWTPEALRRAARDGLTVCRSLRATPRRSGPSCRGRRTSRVCTWDNFAVFSREQQLRLLTPKPGPRGARRSVCDDRRPPRAKRRGRPTLNRLLYADTSPTCTNCS